MFKGLNIDASIQVSIKRFATLLERLDVQLQCPDYASDERLSGKQKQSDEKISRAVADLSIFFNTLNPENLETLCQLAGKNKSGKHDPLRDWWQLFSYEIQNICHNELAKQGKDIVEIMKKNLHKT